MESEDAFKPQLRLHRWSWLFSLTTSFRQMILPLLALLVFGARGEDTPFTPLFFVLVVAALLAHALWRQWTFRYGFGPRGLVIHEGVFFRNVRQLEYARIENIDTKRGLLHRLLGVAEVSVQTSTGGKPEAAISVLDLDAVHEMRERVFADAGRAIATAEVEEALPLLRLPIAELVRYGLIDNRGLIIVAAAGGLLYEMGIFRIDGEIVRDWLANSAIAGIAALGMVIQVLLALSAILSVLLALRLLSILLAVITLFDFTLTRQGKDLRVRHGLLTRVALTLRTPRIQAVHQTQTLLHRWLGRVSLNADLTGDHGGGQNESGSRARTRWLAPVCRPGQVPELMAAALPAIDLTVQPDWQKLAPGALARIFRRTWLLWIVLTLAPALWYLHEWATIVLLAGAPFAWLHAHLYVKHTAWALLPDVLLYRRGWMTKRLAVAPRDRVQSVSLHASPFDRRQRMASVLADTAGGNVLTGEIRIRYLEADVARELLWALYLPPPQRTAGEAVTET